MRISIDTWVLGLLILSAGSCGAVVDGAGKSDASTSGGAGNSGVLSTGGNTSPLGPLSGQISSSPNPDSGSSVCDRIHVDTSSIPPRVLFVQDVSSSMSGQWKPLHDGMVSIAKQFGDRMLLGFVPFASVYFDRVTEIQAATDAQFKTFFSAHDDDCDITDSSIIAPSATSAARIIAAYDSVNSERMVGGTPTYAAMEKARKILVDEAPKDGSPGYAILVTDGAPNCSSPTSDLSADVETSIRKLAAAGVNTFVVGYNYSGAALDQWAKAGKTTKYVNVSDTGKLSEAISSILVGVLPCQFALSSPVEKAKYVRVTVDAKDRELDNPDNGWTLGADKKAITLTGKACNDLRTAGTHTIEVVVECAEVVIY